MRVLVLRLPHHPAVDPAVPALSTTVRAGTFFPQGLPAVALPALEEALGAGGFDTAGVPALAGKLGLQGIGFAVKVGDPGVAWKAGSLPGGEPGVLGLVRGAGRERQGQEEGGETGDGESGHG